MYNPDLRDYRLLFASCPSTRELPLTLRRCQVPYEVGVVRVFEFNSTVQRMSVVVRQLTRPYMELYCKGAPEVLIDLSNTDTGQCFTC